MLWSQQNRRRGTRRTERNGAELPVQRYRVGLDTSSLPYGAYTLKAKVRPGLQSKHATTLAEAESRLIIGPNTCQLIEGKQSAIHVHVPLLRSEANEWTGDYLTLADHAEVLSEAGADGVVALPIYCGNTEDIGDGSPYRRETGVIFEPRYIRVTEVAKALGAQSVLEALNTPQLQQSMTRSLQSGRVNHQEAWAKKRPLLEQVHAHFRDTRQKDRQRRRREENVLVQTTRPTFLSLGPMSKSSPNVKR